MISGFAYAQVGIDTELPKATLDVTGKPSDLTKTDGIIAPRLKGSELKAKDALYTVDQKASLVYITEPLAASDTTSKTVNVTSIGYFYFDGNVWQKLNTGSAALEPWYNAATNQPADSNTQDIYQMGNVSLGKNKVINGAKFDVNGAIRAGNKPAGTVGQNSIAVGDSLTASGQNSTAFGWHNQATGLNAMAWGGQPTHGTTQEERYAVASGVASTAWGYGTRATSWGTTAWGQGNIASAPQATAFGVSNTASGFWTTAFGQRNIASGINSTVFGTDNNANGDISLALGHGNTAGSYAEVVFGRYNAITSGTIGSWNVNDPLLQIGNGSNDSKRANAMTVLKNGNIGISTAKPQAPLHVQTTAFDVAILERANSTPAGLSGGPYLAFRRNESDDPLVNGAVSAKQALGAITFDGNTGNGYPVTGIRGKASIGAWADEDFTPASKGAYLDFSTVANGTVEDLVRMRIASNGNVGIGTTNPATKLEINNGTTNGAIKIVDGTEGEDRVLVSDANGVGTWQIPAVKNIVGTATNATGIEILFDSNSDYRYTGNFITLPSGKWLVNVLMLVPVSNDTQADDYLWIRSTFSDQTSLSIGDVAVQSSDVEQPFLVSYRADGAKYSGIMSGYVLINNTTSAVKTYYYIAGKTASNTSSTTKKVYKFGGNWGENSISAIAIK